MYKKNSNQPYSSLLLPVIILSIFFLIPATAFSFYLAIPTLGLATVFDLATSLDQITRGDALNLLVGMVAAFVAALIAIGWLLRYVAHHSFVVFGVYRIAAGVVVLTWFLWLAP